MSVTASKNENNRSSLRAGIAATIKRLNRRYERLQRKSRIFSWYRLGIFIAGVLATVLILIFGSNLASAAAAAVFISVFSVAAHFHNKLDEGIKKLKAWINIKEVQAARMELDWNVIPGIKYNEKDKFSPVEIDLNVTGEHSLHQLINTAGTEGGKKYLRKLLSPDVDKPDLIYQRQNLIKQLLPLTRFRERLMLVSALSGKREIDTSLIGMWVSDPVNVKNTGKTLTFLVMLSIINIVLFILFSTGTLPAYWVLSLLVYFTVYNLTVGKLQTIFESAELINDELSKLAEIFEYLRINKKIYRGELADLCRPFTEVSSNPSKLIQKTEGYTSFLKMQKNPFVWIFLLCLIPIDHLMAVLLDKIKRKVEAELDTWLGSLFKLEALSSLANFAYLNPEYNFPKIIGESNEPILKAEGLGHPLIKHDKKIRNDLVIEKKGEVDILTGSNMSGKSTLLRSVGINISLAYAGAPVNAESFEIPLLNLFTCIKVSDSVTDGISYFYAEVKRLKKLLDEIKKSSTPVFFLIDEIFRGTNNIERLAGSRAYIKALSASRASGIIATHDLELIKLESEIPNIINYHFRESVADGRMEFDYKLRRGPCPTTNALKIMKMEGLPVE